MLENDPTFALDADAGPPLAEDWKGASGGPVVVNGCILGVIVQVPPNLEAKRLQAVPMWKVLRDESEFFLFVVQDQQSKDRQQRRDRMVQQIEHKLECADIQILDGLAAGLPKLDRQTWAISNLEEKASLLVSELLNLDVGKMLNVCQQAHQKLANDLATKLISEVVQIILPIIYEPSIVERVRVAHSDTKTAFLTLPISHHTIVEIVMAGLDMRGTQYHPCSDEKKLPKGILCLPPPPETGIDSEGNRMVDEIDKHLKKFNWQNSKNFVDALDAYVVWKFTDSDSSKVKPQERIILAADAIEYSSNMKNLTYYLIINEPEDTQDRAALEQALITVRKHYPKLMCMILNSDFTIIREDRKKTLLPLGDLLPKIQSPSTPTNPTVMPTMQSPQTPTFNITAGNVALSTGNGSPTQAGSNQTANINHPEGIKLSELHGLLGELGQAIDQVNSSKARETLNGHVVQAQTEMTKLEPDRNLLKSTLNTIKAGADMLEDGNKIIELCGKALTLLSGLGLL